VSVRRLYLKPGANPANAAETLRELITEARNVRGAQVGVKVGVALREKYLEWVELAEAQLANHTSDADMLQMLQTPRYWRIREIHEHSARPSPLVGAEIDTQVAALERLGADLDTRVKRLSRAAGHITVLDTNVLLEFQPPQYVDWKEVVGGTSPIRLVVPLRVVEELDAKKYSRRADLADRARRLLVQIEGVLGEAGLPGEISSGVTIEVPIDAGPRHRLTDADEEILNTCEEIAQLTGQPVTLVTADTAMRLRAGARAISVAPMPVEYRRKRDGGCVGEDGGKSMSQTREDQGAR
jgi:hypothetical protein